MKNPEIENIRLNKTPLGYEVRLDWDNDRHHLVMVEPPYSVEQVHRAFQRLLPLIAHDQHLQGKDI